MSRGIAIVIRYCEVLQPGIILPLRVDVYALNGAAQNERDEGEAWKRDG